MVAEADADLDIVQSNIQQLKKFCKVIVKGSFAPPVALSPGNKTLILLKETVSKNPAVICYAVQKLIHP